MNIANILKNVDKGAVLYSPLFGEVIFNGIFKSNYPIAVYKDNKIYSRREVLRSQKR